ncbi:MAG: hypothetical protein JWM04_716 [Verrucomicrobiales bacterium]|nr:hypothetical protein [Verrucomicrobiales bacterium]
MNPVSTTLMGFKKTPLKSRQSKKSVFTSLSSHPPPNRTKNFCNKRAGSPSPLPSEPRHRPNAHPNPNAGTTHLLLGGEGQRMRASPFARSAKSPLAQASQKQKHQRCTRIPARVEGPGNPPQRTALLTTIPQNRRNPFSEP